MIVKPKCDLLRVVVLRHGESVWNKENLFSGWADVDLSDQGREEVGEAGRIQEAMQAVGSQASA